MRSLSRLALTALCAVVWTGLASAETPKVALSLDTLDFAAVADMQLDDAFEKSAARGHEDLLLAGLGGPSTMACTNAVPRSALETCVVTAPGTPRTSVPAALAQH